MSREAALRIYTESVNKEDTLFTFIPSLPGKLQVMSEHLNDPITGDQANALNDVLYRRTRFVDMIAWLQDEPVAWHGYFAREKFRAEEADRKLAEYLKQQDEDWEKGIGKFASTLSPEEDARRMAEAKSPLPHQIHPNRIS